MTSREAGIVTLRFPNASYVVAEAEWNFWMDADLIGKSPESMHGFVVGAQRNLGRAKDKVKTVKPGEDIVTGLRVLDTAGHPPVHISLELAGGDGLIVVGDAVPHATVSFAQPQWRFGFDTIAELAIANRSKLLDRAATEKTRLIGYHWPYPGLGFAERKDAGYRFVPA
jgi:glyoxylase-like metal-dependent hydrolase (beta-lactamase superfamily II)